MFPGALISPRGGIGGAAYSTGFPLAFLSLQTRLSLKISIPTPIQDESNRPIPNPPSRTVRPNLPQRWPELQDPNVRPFGNFGAGFDTAIGDFVCEMEEKGFLVVQVEQDAAWDFYCSPWDTGLYFDWSNFLHGVSSSSLRSSFECEGWCKRLAEFKDTYQRCGLMLHLDRIYMFVISWTWRCNLGDASTDSFLIPELSILANFDLDTTELGNLDSRA